MGEGESERWLADVRHRRMLAGALVTLTVVAVPTVIIAFRNPWRYVYLMPFGRSLVVLIVLISAPIMLGSAARLILCKKWAIRVAGGVAAVLTAGMCWCGYQFSMMALAYGNDADGQRTVVAISPNRSFELAVVRYSALTTDFEAVRIRSRSGMRSREAGQNLDCFAKPFDSVGSEATFGSARFLNEYEVEVRTKAGEPWTTTFDPQTLLAAATVSHRCGE